MVEAISKEALIEDLRNKGYFLDKKDSEIKEKELNEIAESEGYYPDKVNELWSKGY